LNALQTRKRLLVLEAEVHRAQMREDWEAIKNSIRHVEEQTGPTRSLITMGGLVMTGLSGLRRFRGGRGSFFSRLMTGLWVASLLRFAFRAGRR
jgi:hypothetical protein